MIFANEGPSSEQFAKDKTAKARSLLSRFGSIVCICLIIFVLPVSNIVPFEGAFLF